eukprot:scaffold6380_cov127-Skeletonema_marinoi.AAC.4
MTDECNDLSPYEMARLERIKRNESRLRELGLVKPKPKPKPKPAAIVRKRKQPSSAPTRSSRRLRELKEGKEQLVEENDDSTNNVDAADTTLIDQITVDYERMPDEPERLDDEEFQVTLCELIRRRRNDDEFAKGKEVNEIESDLLSVWGIGPSKATAGGFGWEMLDILNTPENENYLMLSRKNDEAEDKK